MVFCGLINWIKWIQIGPASNQSFCHVYNGGFRVDECLSSWRGGRLRWWLFFWVFDMELGGSARCDEWVDGEREGWARRGCHKVARKEDTRMGRRANFGLGRRDVVCIERVPRCLVWDV